MQEGSNGFGQTFQELSDAACRRSAQALRVWVEFAQEPGPHRSREDDPLGAEVDETLEEFGGDFRAAIRALLHDIAALAGDFAAHVSRGYVRGGVSRVGRRVGERKETGAGK